MEDQLCGGTGLSIFIVMQDETIVHDAMLFCKVSRGMEMVGINLTLAGWLLLTRMYPGTQKNIGGAVLASFRDHGLTEGVGNIQVKVLLY